MDPSKRTFCECFHILYRLPQKDVLAHESEVFYPYPEAPPFWQVLGLLFIRGNAGGYPFRKKSSLSSTSTAVVCGNPCAGRRDCAGRQPCPGAPLIFLFCPFKLY